MSNPYFNSRDKHLRKAAKHYRRAVEMHYMGIWLDQIHAFTKKQHEDIKMMNDEFKRIEARRNLIAKKVDELTKNLGMDIKEAK